MTKETQPGSPTKARPAQWAQDAEAAPTSSSALDVRFRRRASCAFSIACSPFPATRVQASPAAAPHTSESAASAKGGGAGANGEGHAQTGEATFKVWRLTTSRATASRVAHAGNEAVPPPMPGMNRRAGWSKHTGAGRRCAVGEGAGRARAATEPSSRAPSPQGPPERVTVARRNPPLPPHPLGLPRPPVPSPPARLKQPLPKVQGKGVEEEARLKQPLPPPQVKETPSRGAPQTAAAGRRRRGRTPGRPWRPAMMRCEAAACPCAARGAGGTFKLERGGAHAHDGTPRDQSISVLAQASRNNDNKLQSIPHKKAMEINN